MTPLILESIISTAKNMIGKYFQSDADKEKAKIALAKLQAQPQLLQLMINLSESKSKSFFIAGWRPFIGWAVSILFCLGCFYDFVIYPVLNDFGIKAIEIELGPLLAILAGLLGFGGLRTYDKLRGTTITYGKDILKGEDHEK